MKKTIKKKAVRRSTSVNAKTRSPYHDENGNFKKGNPGGPGNPLAKQCHQLRSALMQTATREDMEQIARVLIRKAKAGNLGAIKLLLERVLGGPQALDVMVETEELHARMKELEEMLVRQQDPSHPLRLRA